MKVLKLSVKKSVDDVCKEIENMIPCVLGTKPNKTKEERAIVYYPARGYAGIDDNLMDDIQIVVRKVNNSLTSIKLENSEKSKETEHFIRQLANRDWELHYFEKAYSTLNRVLFGMFPKEN